MFKVLYFGAIGLMGIAIIGLLEIAFFEEVVNTQHQFAWLFVFFLGAFFKQLLQEYGKKK